MHLATELERIGDHAAGIARLVERMEHEAEIDSLHKLPKMAKRARRMVQKGIKAFVDAFQEALQEMRDDDYIRRATYLLWVGHNLERIGDRATNIAERVIFMTTGNFVENVLTMDLDEDEP
jgi:phosphate transport system protein